MNLKQIQFGIIKVCIKRDNKFKSFFYIKKAVSLLNMGRVDESIICYTEALKINPNNDLAWSNKGN